MPDSPQDLHKKVLGKKGEKLALQYLKKQGYKLLKTNYRTPFGEADIVMHEGDETVFIEVNTRIPSARNGQVLRFRPVTADEAHKVLPHIRLGSALPHLNLPAAGSEPNAFIVICSTVAEDKWVDIDLGISAQSMLLQAVEIGLNGICIGAFDKAKITEALGLELEPLLIIAIGRGTDRIELVEIAADESHTYYRENGVHYVPKVKADELILG